MGQFEELTPEQRDPLFKLVEFQRKSEKDITFTRNGADIYPPGDREAVVIADSSLVGAWAERKYIYLYRPDRTPSEGVVRTLAFSSPELRLMPLALDYYDWIHKPSWRRWLTEQKDAWSSESKAAIVSLIVAILTIVIAKWLGY